MEQALSLPEIRRTIVLFLRPRDYKSCALVSRAWAELVIPWIWYSVTPPMLFSPEDLEILHKNRSLVRTLHTNRYETRVDFFTWFQKLQVLWLGYADCNVESWMDYADLIRRNRLSLRRIDLYCSDARDSVILREAFDCPLLKHLYYSDISIKERDLVESFIKACTGLTTLYLWRVIFVGESQQMFNGQAFTNLERLKVEVVRGPYLDILRACPNLKALTLLECDSVSVAAFLEVITVHCRQLCVLRYGDCGFDECGDFEKVAKALPPMKQLQGMNSVMGNYIPIPAYSRHFQNLQAIQLREFYGGDFKIGQILFSSCPNLRSCVGAVLKAEDIGSGLPWVCQRLEHLEVHTIVHPEKAQLHSIVCHQLSQLKNLRILKTNMEWWAPSIDSRRRHFSPRLANGLELLASLFRLEYLYVGVFQEAWRAEEVEWMAQAWPNLESIYCDLNEAGKVHPRVCEQLDVFRNCREFPNFDSIDFIEL